MNRFDKRELSSRAASAHRINLAVRFQDVDAAGIVFFARYFEYVHLAYESFLAEAGHPLAEVIREKKWAAPLKHVEADYFSPLRFGDELGVSLVAAEVQDSEISLGWRLACIRGEDELVCAVAQTVHTFVELPRFVRTPVPASIAAALQKLGESPCS